MNMNAYWSVYLFLAIVYLGFMFSSPHPVRYAIASFPFGSKRGALNGLFAGCGILIFCTLAAALFP